MMANNVFANGREIACKAADGKSICSFPDVCFTLPQTPATPPGVPIPYPNTAYAKDTTKGSKTVKISGNEVMLKNKSYFKKSTGDEAGNAPKKGIVTSKITGKVYFTSWSSNVKFEGKNVVRHLDLTTHNHGSDPPNTGPWLYQDTAIFDNFLTNQTNSCCSDVPTPITPEACEKAGNDPAGCDYYQKRYDDYVNRHSCCDEKSSPPDYYLEYGLKYCLRFTEETYPNLSLKGQAWLEKARCNLQRMMEQGLQNNPELELDSKQFREFAFDTHPKAYLDAGLADLSLSDWYEIAKTPDIKEWGSWETWEQGAETGWGALKHKAKNAWGWVKSVFD